MKRKQVRCHCGSQAVLRHASYVHGDNTRDEYLYVCARYPRCDSYVGVHHKNKKPLGTLADKPLRSKRMQAHTAFDRLWRNGLMKKWQAYVWMQAKLGLNEQQAHIACFSEYMCDRLIDECTRVFRNNHMAS